MEDMVAGGDASVFGTVDSGSTGGKFPADDDDAYNPGDSRMYSLLGKIQRRIPVANKRKKKKHRKAK